MPKAAELLQILDDARREIPAITKIEEFGQDKDAIRFELVDWRPRNEGEVFGGYAMFNERLVVIPVGDDAPMLTSPGVEILIPMGEDENQPPPMLMYAMLDAAHQFPGASPRWNPRNGLISVGSLIFSASPEALPEAPEIRRGVLSVIGLFYQTVFNLWSREILGVGGAAVEPIVEERNRKMRELIGEMPTL